MKKILEKSGNFVRGKKWEPSVMQKSTSFSSIHCQGYIVAEFK